VKKTWNFAVFLGKISKKSVFFCKILKFFVNFCKKSWKFAKKCIFFKKSEKKWKFWFFKGGSAAYGKNRTFAKVVFFESEKKWKFRKILMNFLKRAKGSDLHMIFEVDFCEKSENFDEISKKSEFLKHVKIVFFWKKFEKNLKKSEFFHKIL
jgi:hypothetical protein